jgi:DNA ligase-1
MTYDSLCRVFADIEATTKRLKITSLLSDYYVTCIRQAPESLGTVVYLCLNKICPDYEGKELGIGESIILKSIEKSTGSSLADIKKDAQVKGDLGQVAQVSLLRELTREGL